MARMRRDKVAGGTPAAAHANGNGNGDEKRKHDGAEMKAKVKVKTAGDEKGKGKGKNKGARKEAAREEAEGGEGGVQLVTGAQDGDGDPGLARDLSLFLSGLKGGGKEGPGTGKKEGKAGAMGAGREKIANADKNKNAGTDIKTNAKAKANTQRTVDEGPRSRAAGDQPKRREKKGDSTKAEAGETTKTKANAKARASAADDAPPPASTAPKSESGLLLIPPTPHWYTALPPLPPLALALPAPTSAQLAAISSRAYALLDADTARYHASGSGARGRSEGDRRFLETILREGTLSDRLSALTLCVREAPVHERAGLERLVGMMARRGGGGGGGKEGKEGRRPRGGGREEGLKAVRCVVDWWVGGGAPERKLRYLRDQPVLHPAATDAHLALWAFEDWLKKWFFGVLGVLETYSLDPLVYVRTQTLAFISTLLRDKPEQEQNLLRLLVNKLGDTEKSICSRASYHLLQLLQAHPAMKAVIVREIKALVFRPVGPGPASAARSDEKGVLGEKGRGRTDENGKGGAAGEHVLKHIRFADEDGEGDSVGGEGKAGKEKGEKRGREKRAARGRLDAKSRGSGGGGNRGRHGEKGGQHGAGVAGGMGRWNAHAWYYAAVTLNQVVLTPSDADRAVARTLIGIYFEMFEEVLGARSGGGGAVGGDGGGEEGEEDDGNAKGKGKGKARAKEVKGAAGFAEVEDATSRLLSAVLTGVNRALPFAKIDVAEDETFKSHIDTLFLITHTSTFNISLQALLLILQITTTLSSHPSHSSSSSSPVSTFTTALTDRFYRTLYASLTDARLAESNKQAMYLNLLFKALKADLNTERVKAFVRRFVQVLVVGVGGGGGAEFVAGGLYLLGELFQTIPALKSWLGGERGKRVSAADAEAEYDPRKREPQFAHASASPMYELLPLLHHYHPAVALHARQLFMAQPLTASPDLALNTLSHFLDRFVYKNAKKPKTRGPSAMQPAASVVDGASGVKMSKGDVMDDGPLVNEEGWWKKRVEDVPVDQVFFHQFFTKKRQREEEKAAKVGRRKGHEDLSDSDSEDEDEADGAGSSDGEVEEPAPGRVEDEEDEEDSDKEEAEIWKAMKATMPAELQDDDLMEDSEDEDDDIPSGLDDDSDDDAILDEDGALEHSDKSEAGDEDEDEDGEDAFSLVEGSDAEDLLSLDADVPEAMGLIEYDGSDASDEEQEEWGGISEDKTSEKGKRKRDEESGRSRKKKLRSLPTFASYEDYARMIEDAPEDNL